MPVVMLMLMFKKQDTQKNACRVAQRKAGDAKRYRVGGERGRDSAPGWPQEARGRRGLPAKERGGGVGSWHLLSRSPRLARPESRSHSAAGSTPSSCPRGAAMGGRRQQGAPERRKEPRDVHRTRGGQRENKTRQEKGKIRGAGVKGRGKNEW